MAAALVGICWDQDHGTVEARGYVKLLSQRMAEEVPLVIESQKLLEKLRQNKLGGIDPFGAITPSGSSARWHSSGDNPNLRFSHGPF